MRIKIDAFNKIEYRKYSGHLEFEINLDELNLIKSGDGEGIKTYNKLLEAIRYICEEIGKGTKIIE